MESLPCKNETAQLIKILTMLEKNGYKGKIRVDFSIISDMKYYNGFVFKGFINGIPTSVLSGGQYDSLMKKMKRDEKAIGFAVYLDMLEFLYKNSDCYDADTVILYDGKTDIDSINDAARHFSKDGGTVMVQRNLPEKARYKQIVKVTEGGVKILENNA